MQERQKEIRVLHVDDEPGFLALTKRHLEDRGGFCVDTAATAEDGLARLRDGSYDVVVADYQMPVMNGLQFLRTLREDNNTIPFIIFTGRGREEVAIEALNSGANHYLQKGGDFESMFGTLAHALREVMAKKRVEEALCASEELYRTMIEHTGTGICILEKDTTVLFVNQEYARITGYSKEEVEGTSWTDYVFKEDQAMMLARHRQRRIDDRRVPSVYEFRLVTKSGAVKHMLLNVQLIPGTGRTLASMIDITDRKKTEEALRASEERFRNLAEGAPFAISIMRSDTSFAYLNPQFTRTFGYTCRDLPNKAAWFQTAYPDAAYRNEVMATWQKDLLEAQTVGAIMPRIFTVRCKNGEDKIIQFQSVILKDGTHIVTYEDITAQAEADKALRTREQEFQTIIDSLPLSIFHLDAESRFVHVSEVLAQRYGQRPEQFIGRSTRELFPKEAGGYMKSDREVLETGEPQIGKIRKIRTSQGVRWMRLDKVPLKDAEGRVTGIIGFELDVSDQERTEEALRESKQRLRTFMDSATDFFTLWDADLTLIDLNQSARDFFAPGTEKCDLLGRTIAQFTPYACFGERIEQFKTVMETGEPFIADELIQHSDFGHVYLTVRAFRAGDGLGIIIRDITERKRAENQLAGIVNGSTIPTFVIDREHKITHWNAALESLTGISRDAVLGTSDQWKPFYPAKRPVMADLIVDEAPEAEFRERYGTRYKKSALIEGAFEVLDFFFDHDERGGKWLLFTAAPLRDSTGALYGAIETLQDITKRKQAEEKYRSLVESTDDSIYLVDRACRYLFINDKHLSRLKVPRTEVLGRTYGDFHSEAEEREFAEMVMAVFERGESRSHEHRSRRDGRYFLRTLSPVKDHRDHTTAVTVISKDITARKQMEQELQMILNYVPLGIFHIDNEGRYVHINEALSQRYGLTPEAFKGRSTRELFPGEAEQYLKSDRELLARGEPQIGTIGKIKTHQGERWVRLDKVPIKDAEGHVTGIIGFELDVTEQKRLLNELEAKNRELERFTYAVSHDLRSPLVTIQGFICMLQLDLEMNDRTKAEDDLMFIANAATKMDALLHDTLELSRIGRIVNPPEAVPFAEIIQDALAQTAGALKAANVTVSFAEDFPTVYADRMRIEEVLVNLISNGVKFMGDQAEPKLELGYHEDGTEAVFYVKDNGKGLAEGEHEKVFELFYRADMSTEGTGAGLAISKRIIEVHGGRIWINSEPGKGCMVSFTLPLRET